MAKDELKLEVYASKEEVCDYEMHVYDVKTQVVDKNAYQAIRGVCRKLSNYNKFGIFEDGQRIYSMKEIKMGKNKPSDFELEYLGVKKLKASENKKVFEGLIKYLIKEKLSKVYVTNERFQCDYRKYSTINDILSSYVKTRNGYLIMTTPDKAVKLRRKYDIRVQIGDDSRAYLWINTTSVFESTDSIDKMLEKKMYVIGKYVRNEWSSFSQTGVIESVGPNTVTDKMDFGMSLKDYYVNCKKEGFWVRDIADDTNVINVKMDGTKSIMSFYPQALRPIVTREYIKKNYPDFSLKIEDYVKRDMMSRIETDCEFIKDIGKIDAMGGLSFETECCSVDRLGFKKGITTAPTLVCGDGKTIMCGEEYKVFNYGFYMKPKNKLKIGYLYPKGQYDLMKEVVNEIYSFSCLGAYQGMKNKYIHEKLIDIQTAAMIKKEYKPGSITDYKCAAQQFKDVEDIDLVIALVPDMDDEDSPYNPFKAVWAEENIPSQMITMNTARLFQKGKAEGTKTKHYLYNIVLGILGKTGGVPWVVENMPGDVDCFVGIDVSTPEKGLHVPACSVVFDKQGRLINFYRPKFAQKGEKIGTDVLQEIFDNVVMSYQNTYKKKLKSIVIHRDGFSNEDKEWYDRYFGSQKINYSIIEIRKNIGAKMLLDEEGTIENPAIGSCVYNDKMAYLITTDIRKNGSPNPLIIEKSCGNIEMSDALKQIFYLTQLHAGSTQKTRLPITTGYANKICKNINYVPVGRIENKLFFL